MKYSNEQLWQRFNQYYREFPAIGLAVDVSRMNFPDDFLPGIEPRMQAAFKAMAALEAGAIANPDENRMVGHYWLRNSPLAPTPELRQEIDDTLAAIKSFASQVHTGTLRGANGPFRKLLVIGIGGSALGPQFVASALGHPQTDKLSVHFFDNTDPDGMDKVLATLGDSLGETLAVVISKSGGTKETRNGMLEAKAAYQAADLDFAAHAVAITGEGSALDQVAVSEKWLRRFPMWDWVGGRTSELSAVGLLPAALQGIDIDQMLKGARETDQLTRTPETLANPAAILAAMWFYSDNGKGSKDMVVLPYKDRLELFSKYLQQLIMESIGKEKDLNGKIVNQGIAVYGNKGSTDQHAYVQQLRDGIPNFFATFIEVLEDRQSKELEVEPGVTSGDYLSGFLLGTRTALYQNDRESITLTINKLSDFSVGSLIALYERAVGLYASLVNINAYHQPGVEAGKKAAGEVLTVQLKIARYLADHRGQSFSADQIAAHLGTPGQAETIFKVCSHLAANPSKGVSKKTGKAPINTTFSAF